MTKTARAWEAALTKDSGTERTRVGLALQEGARVAVLGGGPAGTFFSIFLSDMARRIGLDLDVRIHESRDFSMPGPAGCNMCGGIISESLVQTLATEGIILPPTVVERGIDSYILHMEEGSVRIQTPLEEKRIAAVHRGAGPRGMKEQKWRSFDGYLLELAIARGANLVRGRIDDVKWNDGRPGIKVRGGEIKTYDLLAVAIGVNTSTIKLFEDLGIGYKTPKTTKTYINELYLGQETVDQCLGSSMHVFLLDLPRLEFAALVPKGDYVTVCLLGHDIDGALVHSFMSSPQVKRCLPEGYEVPADSCHCTPRINIDGAFQPFSDRIVFIGDCGVARLYKDGIGSAYRTAKAAAVTAIFNGVSADSFRRHYWPVCQAINRDNGLGKLVFKVTSMQQKRAHDRRGILRMVRREQGLRNGHRPMSAVMWDMFTGSAPYKEVLLRTLRPAFVARLVWEVIAGTVVGVGSPADGE